MGWVGHSLPYAVYVTNRAAVYVTDCWMCRTLAAEQQRRRSSVELSGDNGERLRRWQRSGDGSSSDVGSFVRRYEKTFKVAHEIKFLRVLLRNC